MENVSLRQVINARMQNSGVTQNTAYDANGQTFGDVWSMIFASMQQNSQGVLGNQAGINQGTEGFDVMNMLNNVTENDESDDQKEMLSQLAAMIMAMPQQQSENLLNQLQQTGTGYDTLQGVTFTKPQLDSLHSLYNQIGTQPTEEENKAVQDAFNKMVVEIVSQTKGDAQGRQQSNAGENPMFLEQGFKNAISQAQKLMQTEENADDAQALSVSQLQQILDETRTTQAQNPVAIPMQKLDSQDLIEQFKQSLQAQTKNMQEFTLKLKPEGLGEITVKLTQGDKGIAMNITTASENVAKMISAELGNLQQALKPLNATVQTVVAQTSETAQYNFAGNQFGQNNSQQFYMSRQQKSAYSGSNTSLDDEQLLNAITTASRISSSALDTYI